MSDRGELEIEVRALIAAGDFEGALDRVKVAAHGVSAELFHEAILLQARFSRLTRESRRGTVSREQADVDLNRLSAALLGLLADVARAGPARVPAPRSGASSLRPEHVGAPRDLTLQQISGISNLKQISWIEVGIRQARSVCRILTPESSAGTGFHVGGGVVMTNNHVLPTPEIAAKSQVEFNYQQGETGDFLPTVRYGLDAAGFHTSAELDYTLIRIRPEAGKPPVESWGKLTLNPNADPVPAEHVTIIQHPNGGYKQIAMTANWVLAVASPNLLYTTETMPGSSGSPVFNDSWQVIAIHHAKGDLHKDARGALRYVNEGILMSAIRKDAGERWPR